MSFPLLAKMFNSIAWTSEPLLVNEMSPTSVRNAFFGFVGFVGEVASVLAPYLNSLVGAAGGRSACRGPCTRWRRRC